MANHYEHYQSWYPSLSGVGGSAVSNLLLPGLGAVTGPVTAGITSAAMSPPGDRLRNALTTSGAQLAGSLGGGLGGAALGGGLGYLGSKAFDWDTQKASIIGAALGSILGSMAGGPLGAYAMGEHIRKQGQ